MLAKKSRRRLRVKKYNIGRDQRCKNYVGSSRGAQRKTGKDRGKTTYKTIQDLAMITSDWAGIRGGARGGRMEKLDLKLRDIL